MRTVTLSSQNNPQPTPQPPPPPPPQPDPPFKKSLSPKQEELIRKMIEKIVAEELNKRFAKLAT